MPRYRTRQSGNEPVETLQQAMSGLSSQLSVNNHNFIASISTDDVVELLKEKYANVSERTTTLNEKLSEELSQKMSEIGRLDAAKPRDDKIKKRMDTVSLNRNSMLKSFSVLQERLREFFEVKGIQVTQEITFGDVKDAIALDKLSAGEKHIFSFLCYNTFVQNTPIFIDEPELSFHVDWQRLLLPTLLEQDTNNQFFIATHSPFIYSRYPEKEILLGTDRGDS